MTQEKIKCAMTQHLRTKHPGKPGSGKITKNRRTRREDDGERSIASLLVDAYIDRACGEPVEDWLSEMME